MRGLSTLHVEFTTRLDTRRNSDPVVMRHGQQVFLVELIGRWFSPLSRMSGVGLATLLDDLRNDGHRGSQSVLGLGRQNGGRAPGESCSPIASGCSRWMASAVAVCIARLMTGTSARG